MILGYFRPARKFLHAMSHNMDYVKFGKRYKMKVKFEIPGKPIVESNAVTFVSRTPATDSFTFVSTRDRDLVWIDLADLGVSSTPNHPQDTVLYVDRLRDLYWSVEV